ncbi:flavin monoamine oxidase family protein [Actinoallomurus sp. NPDC052308]|uniref:flavin monoamine oxidase family protein n=1 Tax=Actinoallomurus sp. NPDC052308 TaxID=3155530 RepID=UPI003444E32D
MGNRPEGVMGSAVTRRSFLRAVGIAGGAGVLFETMGALGLAPTAADAAGRPFVPPSRADFALSGRKAPKVVILGGGIAGLATAYELGKAGYDCRILEAKNRPGGRNWTVRGGTVERELGGYEQRATFAPGLYMNAGPARIAQFMLTLDYCRELGVAIEPFVNQNADAYVYYDNAGPMSDVRTTDRAVKADTYGYISELLAKATSQGALDAELSADDKDRLMAFLEDFGALTRTGGEWRYTGTDRRGYSVLPDAADQPGTVLGPPPSLHNVLASRLGRNLSFELGWDQAMMMFQPIGGMDRIPYALADRIGGHRIEYQAEVLEVTDQPDAVHVRYRDAKGRQRMAQGDYCVATLPAYLMARIPTNLGAAVKAALEYPTRVHVGKLGLEYRRRWWEEDDRIYGGITNTDLDISQIWYPSHGYHGKGGVLLGYYTQGPGTDAFDRMSPADRIKHALAQGVKIHGPKYAKEVVSAFAVAWDRIPHIETGWVAWPSWTSGQYELLNQPHGRVYFAGEWLTRFMGWQAGAFLSARYVVSEIHQRALATPR